MALLVGGEWRIEGQGGFLLSSSEHFGDPRTDGHAMPFYRSLGDAGRPKVEGVEVWAEGGLRFAFDAGHVLLVLPSGEAHEEGSLWLLTEVWRYMPPADDPRGQLVLDTRGLGWRR